MSEKTTEKTTETITATKLVSIYFRGASHELTEEEAMLLRDALLDILPLHDKKQESPYMWPNKLPQWQPSSPPLYPTCQPCIHQVIPEHLPTYQTTSNTAEES